MANFRRRDMACPPNLHGSARHIFHQNVITALRSTLFQATCWDLDAALMLRPHVEILIEQWLHFRHLAT